MTTLNDVQITNGQTSDVSQLNKLLGGIFISEFYNAENLSATRVLLDADMPIQRFNCNGADRIARMPAGSTSTNHPYLLVNSTSSGTYKLTVQDNAGTVTLIALNPAEFAVLMPDGNGGYFVINNPFSVVVSPSQITSNQNNYNPTGASSANVLRIDTDASREITGFGFPAAYKTVLVVNAGSNPAVFKNESGSSTAANRFSFGADLTLATKQAVMMWYDPTSSRWCSVGGVGSSGSSSSSGLPTGYLYGLTLANNATDATNDIDIAVGKCRDSTDAEDMALASALTKRLDANWVVGTNQGGLDTGTVANGTYHVWLIKRSDTGVVDVLFSTSASSPTMPTNYDYKRRIGSIVRVSAAIKAFVQDGDRFMWKTPVQDVNVTNPGTSAVTRTLTVPIGIRVRAIINVYGGGNSGAADNPKAVYINDLSLDDVTLAGASAFSVYAYSGAAAQSGLGSMAEVLTDTSGQVRSKVQISTTNTSLAINTHGWVDERDSGNTGGGGGGGGALSDGDYGDVIVGGSGTTMTIDNDAVTLAKLVNATAQYKLLGRVSPSSGDFEEITGSANVFSLLQAADYAAMRTLLKIGSLHDAPNSAISMASTSFVDILSKTITVAAGDTIEIVVKGELLNNSGGTRTPNYQLDFDGVVVNFADTTLANSASARALIELKATISVLSTSNAKLQLRASRTSGVAANTVTATDNRRMAWQTTATDVTGSVTCNIQASSDSASATQTFYLNAWEIRVLNTSP
jgi:hypothetical protein